MPSRRKSTPCKILTVQPESDNSAAGAQQQTDDCGRTENMLTIDVVADDSPAPTGSDISDQLTSAEPVTVIKVQPESPGECSRRVMEDEMDTDEQPVLPITGKKDSLKSGTKDFTDENLILHYMRENSKLVASILAEKDLSGNHKELCLQQIIASMKNARDKLRSVNKDQVPKLGSVPSFLGMDATALFQKQKMNSVVLRHISLHKRMSFSDQICEPLLSVALFRCCFSLGRNPLFSFIAKHLLLSSCRFFVQNPLSNG